MLNSTVHEIGILGRVWYLIVSTLDLCTLTYSDHPSYDTWIGATDDVQEMTFLWYGIDEPLSHGYTNWAHHEPEGRDDDDDDEQDCVYINSHDWEWHDHECDDDMYYICEKP